MKGWTWRRQAGDEPAVPIAPPAKKSTEIKGWLSTAPQEKATTTSGGHSCALLSTAPHNYVFSHYPSCLRRHASRQLLWIPAKSMPE
jgi:hypothetical protein